MTRNRSNTPRVTALLLALSILVSACNSATVKKSKATPARLDTPDEYSFTITEQTRIDADTRVDYDRAIALLEQGDSAGGISLLEQVAESAPRLSAPHIDLGVAYHRAGNLEAAEKNLKLIVRSGTKVLTYDDEGSVVVLNSGIQQARSQGHPRAL